jgi:competence protein ComEC
MQTAARTPPFGIRVAIALLAGIGACLLLPRLPALALLSCCAVGGANAWWRGGPRLRPAGAFLAGFALAGLHAAFALQAQLPVDGDARGFVVSGQVVELPVSEPRRTRFLFRVDGGEDQPAALRGRMLRLAWYDGEETPRQPVGAGSRWRFQVRLRAPRGLRNPGGADGEMHAMARRIAATGYVRNPELARRLSPPAGIDAWREAMSARIAHAIERPSSRFVRALALGDTRGFDERDWELLRAAGLTHLVAISGFHVGLVAGFFALAAGGLWRLLPGLGRVLARPQAGAIAAMLGAGAYAAVAGFALPTVRTAAMIAVVVSARCWRRPFRIADALALAAIAVLLADPLAVLGAGFWLSFLGVAWLLWCLPRAGNRPVRDFLDAQGVATVGLLPLSAFIFGQASLAGPLANLVAVPWWSLVVVPLSLLGTALEMVGDGAGEWTWRSAAWSFDLAWPLFEWLGGSPLSVWWLPEPAWFALPLALLGAFWLLLPRGVPGKPLALLLWLPLLWPQRGLPARGDFELTTIDVGQGLAVLVRTSGHSLLYDMGPAVTDGFDAGERAVVPALRALGVRRLDTAVVSHADNDHAGGWPAVKRQFPARATWAPDGSPTPASRRCVAGRAWTRDGVRFRFIHPTPHFPYFRNESSCVLRIEGRHGSALLTGDIGEVVERDLLRRERAALRADVVVVAHHGSGGSSDPGFVAATGARVALASVGAGNRFGHPKREVVERWCDAGAEFLSTADSGAIRVGIGANGIRVDRRRASHPRPWDAARRAEASAGPPCNGVTAVPAS